jgi:hypothetical protein
VTVARGVLPRGALTRESLTESHIRTIAVLAGVSYPTARAYFAGRSIGSVLHVLRLQRASDAYGVVPPRFMRAAEGQYVAHDDFLPRLPPDMR